MGFVRENTGHVAHALLAVLVAGAKPLSDQPGAAWSESQSMLRSMGGLNALEKMIKEFDAETVPVSRFKLFKLYSSKVKEFNEAHFKAERSSVSVKFFRFLTVNQQINKLSNSVKGKLILRLQADYEVHSEDLVLLR